MTIARSQQIDLSSTRYYHCISRCVRQTYLYGKNILTGKDYSHRKPWILNRIKFLSSIFAIDVCAYAIMSNHVHLVLYINLEEVDSWNDDEVQRRWQLLYPKNYSQFFSLSENLDQLQMTQKILEWRQRLTSISWFMSCLNEKIARMCNREDECTGRFWEGRYKCQALLDQGAVLSAMIYVDLNPVRAQLAETPEDSEFTSIFDRIQLITKGSENNENEGNCFEDKNTLPQPSHLLKLKDFFHTSCTLDFGLLDYIDLTDNVGRIFREDKKGKIPDKFLPILVRLQIHPEHWIEYINSLEESFSFAVGHYENISRYLHNKRKTTRYKKNIKKYYKLAV